MAAHFVVATANSARVTVVVQLAAAAVEMCQCSANLVLLSAVLSVPSELSILFYFALPKTVRLRIRAESAESELLRTGLGMIIAKNAGTWPLTDFSLDSEISKRKFLSNNHSLIICAWRIISSGQGIDTLC